MTGGCWWSLQFAFAIVGGEVGLIATMRLSDDDLERATASCDQGNSFDSTGLERWVCFEIHDRNSYNICLGNTLCAAIFENCNPKSGGLEAHLGMSLQIYIELRF